MLIKFIELQNFRKLSAIRIDFSAETTLFVGANNSGKTSAMVALRHFLIDPKRFTTNDFTLSRWSGINQIGEKWAAADFKLPSEGLSETEWDPFLPALDLWLDVAPGEFHHVRDVLPTLKWTGGLLGIRLRYEPLELEKLYANFVKAVNENRTTRAKVADKKDGGSGGEVNLWPRTLRDFLNVTLRTHFGLRAYILNPALIKNPTNGAARPQPLPKLAAIEGNPISGLIQIDEIPAQRSLGDSGSDPGADADAKKGSGQQRLSTQLRAYYDTHLDPSRSPQPEDMDALRAIEEAQRAFDGRLDKAFKPPLSELEDLNYPGVSNPRLTLMTKLLPTDGLKHSSAVQYRLTGDRSALPGDIPMLPEEYNGLGYQNLISMVFRLMSHRDAWMRVGKAAKKEEAESARLVIPPLHLVLVEEPEAHLHCQVQQVFVQKAYGVLRNHADLKTSTKLRTQMLISTHSSHVAHECEFASVRYFRRLSAPTERDVPISVVINMSEVFGPDDDTARFVARYLRITHCDLFFADAAILIEGDAERILLPHFIRQHYKGLHRCYLSILQIGGSHAHRLRQLIEHLGLTCLIVTDLDAGEAAGHHRAVRPSRGKGQVTTNPTLKDWHPKKTAVDELLATPDAGKLLISGTPSVPVRFAYQTGVLLPEADWGPKAEAIPSTFEDALVLANLSWFGSLTTKDETASFVAAIKNAGKDAGKLSDNLYTAVEGCTKAAFALDLLWIKNATDLRPPEYISTGLDWLQRQLVPEASPTPTTSEATGGAKVEAAMKVVAAKARAKK